MQYNTTSFYLWRPEIHYWIFHNMIDSGSHYFEAFIAVQQTVRTI